MRMKSKNGLSRNLRFVWECLLKGLIRASPFRITAWIPKTLFGWPANWKSGWAVNSRQLSFGTIRLLNNWRNTLQWRLNSRKLRKLHLQIRLCTLLKWSLSPSSAWDADSRVQLDLGSSGTFFKTAKMPFKRFRRTAG